MKTCKLKDIPINDELTIFMNFLSYKCADKLTLHSFKCLLYKVYDINYQILR